MTTIDVDKTIVELLKKYQVYLKLLMAAEQSRMNKTPYKSEIDREADEQDFWDVQRAYDLFRLILENPKKYLYHNQDIMFTCIDDKDEPHLLQAGMPTIFEKLMPLYNLVNQYGGAHVLNMLSSYITFHVQERGAKDPWVYDGKPDFYAGAVLRLNKHVCLMGKSALAKSLNEFLPERMFAVKFAKGK